MILVQWNPYIADTIGNKHFVPTIFSHMTSRDLNYMWAHPKTQNKTKSNVTYYMYLVSGGDKCFTDIKPTLASIPGFLCCV